LFHDTAVWAKAVAMKGSLCEEMLPAE